MVVRPPKSPGLLAVSGEKPGDESMMEESGAVVVVVGTPESPELLTVSSKRPGDDSMTEHPGFSLPEHVELRAVFLALSLKYKENDWLKYIYLQFCMDSPKGLLVHKLRNQ
jgi:hypothetical protein